jgi:pimeloyl-ACP methyl ester carboxylesterase
MTRNCTMSRRQLLAAAAVIPASAAERAATAVTYMETMTFVLVHGAWHGGWAYRKLVPLLRGGGHTVLAPTMTGLGERSHLLSPDVDLHLHVQDIVSVIECEDAERVVLVGHSYGGMVITGVAARVPQRIARLVYIDAFLPDDGKALQDYAHVPKTRNDGWRVPPPGPPSSWGVTDSADVTWMTPRIGDQPLKTFTQPVHAPAVTVPMSNRHFIQCTTAPFFSEAAERAKQRGFRSYELWNGGHDVMITQPQALARLLEGIAQGVQ